MSDAPPAPSRPPGGGTQPRPRSGPGGLVREPEDRRLAGVCSGLADRLGVDVTAVRLAAIVLTLFTPATIVAYVAAAVVLPERRPDQPRVLARRVQFGRLPHPVLAVGVIIAAVAFFDDAWWLAPFPTAVALICVGVWLIVEARSEPGDGGLPWPPGPDRGGSPGPDHGPAGVAPPDAPPRDEAPNDAQPAASAWWDAAPGAPGAPGATGSAGSADPLGAPGSADPTTPFDRFNLTDPTEEISTPRDEPTWRSDPHPSPDTGPSGETTLPASPWWSGGEPEPASATVAPIAPAPPVAVPSAARQPRSPVGLVVVALLLMGGGLAWALAVADVVAIGLTDGLALGLVVVGLGLIVAAWRGRAWALVPLGLLLAGLLAVAETMPVPVDAGIGEQTEVLDTRAELAEDHELFLGELTLDLREAPRTTGRPTEVTAAVGAGRLHVIVPEDARVTVDADIGVGHVSSDGGPAANETGTDLDESFTLAGAAGEPEYDLDLEAGFGVVEVSREP
jgi:phage shock protein PspC (stress-responsive transcriptional regulator)